MSNLTEKLGTLFSKKEVPVEEIVEFRKSRIQHLGREISSIKDEINKSTSNHEAILNSESSEPIRDRIQNRFNKSNRKLVDSLYSKMSKLNQWETNLDRIQKGGSTEKVYAIVTSLSGEVLLLLNSYSGEHNPGVWTLPGGGVEPVDKSSQDALKRELLEETGLEATYTWKVKENKKDDGSKCIYYAVGVEDGSEIRLNSTQVAPEAQVLGMEQHVNYTFMSLDEVRSRPEEDFKPGLRESILECCDPLGEMEKSIQVLEKAYSQKKIGETQFSVAKSKYDSHMKFRYKPLENGYTK